MTRAANLARAESLGEAMVRLAKRGVAAGLLVALALTALPLAGDGTAGAAQRGSGVVKCQTFYESLGVASIFGLSLAGCTDPANTGSSGQGSLISSTPTSQTVLITWAAGGTTTISATITPTSYRVRDCGPQISESEAHLTGQVTADTTGSIK